MKKHVLTTIPLLMLVFLWVSCSDDDSSGETLAEFSSISLELSSTNVLINTPLGFDVTSDTGEKVTSNLDLYVNDQKVESPYKPTTVGSIDVYVKYGELKSNVVTAQVQDAFENSVAPDFKTKMLLEDFTGTWCGACPYAQDAIDRMLEVHKESVVTVAVHYSDEMSNDTTNELVRRFGIRNFPTIYLNRSEWRGIYSNNYSEVQNAIANEAPAGIGIGYTADGNDLNIQVNVAFQDRPSTTHKLVVMLLEDGIVATQAGANPAEGYIHNHVLRHALTGTFGDEIDTNQISSNNTYTVDFEKRLSTLSNIADFSKSEIVAVLYNQNDEVVNVQKLKFN